MIVDKKIVKLNILFSVFQIGFSSLSYYFLYKYLLLQIGPDLMGVWAIVLSISSAANIANLGIGSSVVRFTAKYWTSRESETISRLLQTALLSICILFFIITLVVYTIAPYWIAAVIEKNFFGDAMAILPYSLGCLFLNAISSIYGSCIDGLQKNFIRSVLVISSFAVLITFTYMLVPKHGLMGVAYAQLLQSIFVLVAMISGLKFAFRTHKIFSFKFDRGIFKSIFSFGVKEQIISICQLCFDPLTKSLLSNFGSLSTVTYYEMANRLVLQLRGILISANQVLMPVFTSSQELSPEKTTRLYKEIFSINLLLTLLWLSLIIAFVVPISLVWLGVVNHQFIVIAIIIATGYFFNIIISPAYFSNMGGGKLNQNMIGNIIISVLNIVCSYALGYYFSEIGVVIGWSVALAIGSLYILFAYHKNHGISFKKLVLKPDKKVTVFSFLYGLFFLFFFLKNLTMNIWLMFLIAGVFFVALCIIVYKINPVAKRIKGLIIPKKH